MKRNVYLLLAVCVFAAAAGWGAANARAFYRERTSQREAMASANRSAERVAALIAGADHAGIHGEIADLGEEETSVIRDPKWIHQVSEVMRTTPIAHPTTCMCTGWRTAYFYRNGEVVVSLAAIHGNQLRIHSKDVSGDFPIDEVRWALVSAALEFPKNPPHPLNPPGGG